MSFQLSLAEILAIVLAASIVVAGRHGLLDRGPVRRFVVLCAVGSAVLSGLYVGAYLRGGPRIVDATSYWLEARLFASGMATLPLGPTPAAFAGRFLVRAATAEPSLAVIFPPGYPFLLSLAMRAHAAMLLGPILAALLTASTGWLVARFAPAAGLDARESDRATRVAVLLVTVCGALRYHTADTMSHGLTALLAVVGIAAAAGTTRASSGLAGAALGYAITTRPVTALAVAPFVVYLVVRTAKDRWSRAAIAALAAVPFVVAHALYQRHVTGSFVVSPQTLYYAASDAPAGCFTYGFGADVGCQLEHGDFVRHNLPRGYGLVAATMTTLRRLKMHLGDPLNAWPAFVVVAAAFVWSFRTGRARLLALPPIALIFAYVPFYFDGNYPAGGARFLSEGLVFELALVAIASVAWLRASTRPSWLAWVAPGIACVGFAFFAAADHRQLRDREGGRPMFETAALPVAPPVLVFVNTDHGFDIGYGGTVPVVRRRHDAHDFFVWDAAGRPPAYDYVFDFDGTTPPRLAVMLPDEPRAIEGESLWPPVVQRAGHARIAFDAVDSGGRALALVPDQDGQVDVTLAMPVPALGYVWAFHAQKEAGVALRFEVAIDGRDVFAAALVDVDPGPLPPLDLASDPREARTVSLRVRATTARRARSAAEAAASAPIARLDAVWLEPRTTRFAGRERPFDPP